MREASGNKNSELGSGPVETCLTDNKSGGCGISPAILEPEKAPGLLRKAIAQGLAEATHGELPCGCITCRVWLNRIEACVKDCIAQALGVGALDESPAVVEYERFLKKTWEINCKPAQEESVKLTVVEGSKPDTSAQEK